MARAGNSQLLGLLIEGDELKVVNVNCDGVLRGLQDHENRLLHI